MEDKRAYAAENANDFGTLTLPWDESFRMDFDGKWHIRKDSKKAYGLLGLTEAEVEQTVNGLLIPAHWRAGLETFTKVFTVLAEKESKAQCDLKVMDENGKTRYVRTLFESGQHETGTPTVRVVMLNVSDLVEQGKERARVQENESSLALQQSGIIMHRYEPDTRRAYLPTSIATKYGVDTVVENLEEICLERKLIAEQSLDIWHELFGRIHKGETIGEAYIWLNRTLGKKLHCVRFVRLEKRAGSANAVMLSYEDMSEEYERSKNQTMEKTSLMYAAQKFFPEVLFLNLTKNTYRMIQYDSSTTLNTPRDGQIEEMLGRRKAGVAEEDQETFMATFSREHMEEVLFRQNQDTMHLVYRRPGREGQWYWFETTAMRQSNPFDEDHLVVAMSRNVDEQKAEEIRLQQELQLKGEEIRLTMARLGRILNYYDVPTSTLTIPPSYAMAYGLDEEIPQFPECVKELFGEYMDDETIEKLNNLFDDIRAGIPSGACVIRNQYRDGEIHWERMEYATVFDADGNPRRAVISVDDVTELEHQNAENRRLREKEEFFSLVAQHSDRNLCYYDIATRQPRPWRQESCEHCAMAGLCKNENLRSAQQKGLISQDMGKEIQKIFTDIHQGVPSGEYTLHIRQDDGSLRWFNLKFSNVYGTDGTPVTALLSYQDITEQYEREMTYLRYQQNLERNMNTAQLIFESDLTNDVIERQGGTLFADIDVVGQKQSEFNAKLLQSHVHEDEREFVGHYFSREHLLTQHTDGNRHLELTFEVRFRDGRYRWVRSIVELVMDPYVGHVKGIFSFTDVTDEVAKQREVEKRAQRDGLTGLLNRGTCEERIRQLVGNQDDNGNGGILILADLDDLKGINDTFGHEYGDKAIKTIADALVDCFRKEDVIGRIGGDEYMIFLPNAASAYETIQQTLQSLLRKLSGVAVGNAKDCHIHCSIGAAVEVSGEDDFDSLYKRADRALYHVKRGGKNSVAFYDEAMEQEDYHFRQNQLSLKNAKVFDWDELQHFLESLSIFYPMVVSMNLSGDSYYLMDVDMDEVFALYPASGSMSEFEKKAASLIHRDDMDSVLKSLSRNALLKAYSEGSTNVQCFFRHMDQQGEYSWLKYIVIFRVNAHGDVCAYVLVRWAREREQELDLLRLKKITDMALYSSYEYVGLIDVRTGRYVMYLRNANVDQLVPSSGMFDEVSETFAREHLPEEAGSTFVDEMKLERILQELEGSSQYTCSYATQSGCRQADFTWYEDEHNELLMTVRMC